MPRRIIIITFHSSLISLSASSHHAYESTAGRFTVLSAHAADEASLLVSSRLVASTKACPANHRTDDKHATSSSSSSSPQHHSSLRPVHGKTIVFTVRKRMRKQQNWPAPADLASTHGRTRQRRIDDHTGRMHIVHQTAVHALLSFQLRRIVPHEGNTNVSTTINSNSVHLRRRRR